MTKIIDWRQFVGGDGIVANAEDVAYQVDEALSQDGLLVIENALSPEKTIEFIQHAELFFSQPHPQKERVGYINNNGFIRGYLAYGKESGLPASIFEPKEGFAFGYPWPSDKAAENQLQGTNLWPSPDIYQKATSFQESMMALFHFMTDISLHLVNLIAKALGRSESEMEELCGNGETISLLRVFHYHSASIEHANCLGSSPHTDWGFLTVILQDNVGGLQVQKKDGCWYDVPCLPGSLVVNAGDFLEILSNGRYTSPVHRVLCPFEKRTSFVLFFYPDYDTPMDASMFTPTSNAKYNTLTSLMFDKNAQHMVSTSEFSSDSHSDISLSTEGSIPINGKGKLGMGNIHNISCRSASVDLEVGTFGDYICRKWQQVQRT
eukprot:gene6348-9275_t